MIHINVVGATLTAQRFARMAVEAQPKANLITQKYALMLLTKQKARASGRPGPNTPTGDFRRSSNAQGANRGPVAVWSIGTNRDQARRLEYGFVGFDALGRYYDQPPYPSFVPAAEEIEPLYVAAIRRMASKI